jgi:signal peptidase I
LQVIDHLGAVGATETRLAGALPGETVELVEGTLYIDGVAFAEDYRASGDRSSFGPVTVPADTLFFLGDNRSNSSDSRSRLGFVERDRVIGRAFAIVWPSSNARMLDGAPVLLD